MSKEVLTNAADQSVKVRLLTFEWLPFTDDLSAPESLYESMDALSAESVFFEKHYLQQQGLPGILDGFAVVPSTFFLQFSTATVQPTVPIPDSFSTKAYNWADEAFSGFAAALEEIEQHPFCWMDFSGNDSTPDGLGLGSVLPLIQALCDQDCLVFVTSLCGRNQESTRYDSTLPESLIHAPLWMLGKSITGCRSQTLTGSEDVAHTIECLLHSEVDEGAGGASHLLCLTDIAGTPGEGGSRSVRIETADVIGLRTDEFLLTQAGGIPGDGFSEPEFALYAKPEDIWNVSSVAADYHATVEQLSQRLG